MRSGGGEEVVEEDVEAVAGEGFSAALGSARVGADVGGWVWWLCLVWQHCDVGLGSGGGAGWSGGAEALVAVVEGELGAVAFHVPAVAVELVVVEAAQEDSVVEVEAPRVWWRLQPLRRMEHAQPREVPRRAA